MPLGELRFHSRALGGRPTPFTFYLPDRKTQGPGPYPVLLQLHGAFDDHTSWTVHSRLINYLGELPFIVVMPDGGLSGWANWNSTNERYEDFVMKDLLPFCEHFFPIRPGRWAIGGLSMGGFGALRLGLKFPDRFASIHAHSSVFYGRPPVEDGLVPGLGPEARRDLDVYTHALSAVNLENRPVLALDCGTEDRLIEANRSFHAYLDEIGYPHEYLEGLGGHTWDWWDEHVQRALKQHARVLGVDALPTA